MDHSDERGVTRIHPPSNIGYDGGSLFDFCRGCSVHVSNDIGSRTEHVNIGDLVNDVGCYSDSLDVSIAIFCIKQ